MVCVVCGVGGARDWGTDLPIGKRPTLPHEPPQRNQWENGHSICVTLNRPLCTFCYFNDKSLITNNRKNILHNTRWRLWTDMHLSLGFSYLVFYRCHPHVYLIRARYQVSWHLGHIWPTQASAIPHVKPGSLILKPHLDHKTSARVITNPQLPE